MKNFFKTEWAKLRQMSFAEKRWYIWQYYKLHFFGFGLAAFLVGSVVYNIFINPPPDDFLYIAWIGIPAMPATLEGMSEKLSVIVDDPESQRVIITNYSITADPGFNMAMQTRLMALLQTASIDVFVTTGGGLDELAEQGLLHPTPPVSLAGSPFLEYFGKDSSDVYMAIAGNTRRLDTIIKALEVFLYGA